MATVVTLYPKTITWNGATWNSLGGGPLRVEAEVGGDPVAEQSGDADWNTFLQIANKRCRVVVRLREFKQVYNPGTFSGSIVCTLTSKTATITVTFATMILVSMRPAQDRAAPGDVELIFMHESVDGTTMPMS